MPLRRSPIVSVCLALATLSGCASWVDGDRWTKENPKQGFHYFLPVASFKATPQAGGTVKFEKQLLPDPDEHYVLRPGSFLAAYRFEIKTTDGLLTSVQFNPNATAVAAAAAKATGDLGKAYFDAAQAKKTADAAAETKANEAAVSAQLEYEVAAAKLDALEAAKAAGRPVTEQALLEAELAKAAARAKAEAARRSAGLGALMNAPAPKAGEAFAKAQGPVLYRLAWHKDAKRFFFVASDQFQADTTAPPATEVALSARIKGSGVARRGGKAEMLIILEPSEKIGSIVDVTLKRGTIPRTAFKPAFPSLQGDGTVQVVLHDATPDGDYNLEVRARTMARPAEPQRMVVPIQVRPALPQ